MRLRDLYRVTFSSYTRSGLHSERGDWCFCLSGSSTLLNRVSARGRHRQEIPSASSTWGQLGGLAGQASAASLQRSGTCDRILAEEYYSHLLCDPTSAASIRSKTVELDSVLSHPHTKDGNDNYAGTCYWTKPNTRSSALIICRCLARH